MHFRPSLMPQNCPMSDVLQRFSPATQEWFRGAFDAPTPAQLGAWEAVADGAHALVVAPTGSGKTLSAFLWSIDRLMVEPAPEKPGVRVLYISPLKALAVDVERNLRAPLVGITQTAKRLGTEPPHVRVGVRSGDTPQADRRLQSKNPPDILITTPESLFLMLTSAARESLSTVQTIIIDEVHAVASTKRGAHLAVSLERLDALLEKPAQRIGLSATVRPPEEVARFLAGGRPVTIVSPPSTKRFDLRVVVPVEDMANLPAPPEREGSTSGAVHGGDAAGGGGSNNGQGSIWPHVEESIVDLILEHHSSIVFANSRRLAERLTARLNEIYAERMAMADAHLPPGTADGQVNGTAPAPARTSPSRPPAASMGQAGQTKGLPASASTQADGTDASLLARAHHGSVSKEQRAVIEDDLKTGRLRCVVATSSLELGIDMGAVDLVVQVESPPSVASGLQRVGRAGHQVGEVSRGVIYPKHRADLLHAAVASLRMSNGLIESLAVPKNPLDILAQQTVAACALEPIDVEVWFDMVRRSAPFSNMPRSAYEATLDLLAGRYPSDQFAELRPRIVWDRDAGTLTGRPGAQRLAVTSGGTIPDRGLFGVFMVGGSDAAAGTKDAKTGSGSKGGNRVGELDEEMVYESRVGDVFALGATSWRIQEITHDRVLVTPAFGEPGRLPFWRGDGLGRPAELGRAIGEFTRTLAGAAPEAAVGMMSDAGLDSRAAANLLTFVTEQKAATQHVPSDTTLVVERFRDELGDWRLVLHSPYGMQVHSPWSLAIGARLRERFGLDGASVASDDGIVLRLPDTESEPPGADLFLFDADELEEIVTREVGGSALFASRFRENAARALLLPRRNPGARSPLWQQRQRAAQLLDVARQYPSFPIILETIRECLQDVYDLPALVGLARDLEARRIRVVELETPEPSPFAKSLMFGYVASFVYEGDSPLAERRAAALSLDPTLLAELLGRAELRELLDIGVIEQTERELQRLASDRKARDAEGVVDLLRMLGPLTTLEVRLRVQDEGAPHVEEWLAALVSAKRALQVSFAGSVWWIAIEDASRLRDALGVPIPFGVPDAFIEPVADPVGDLIARYARSHGPFTASEAAARFGLGTAVVTDTLRRLETSRRVVEGEFRPLGLLADGAAGAVASIGAEWCDAEILRRLRRRSLAALRHEVEPVDTTTFARFLPAWQHVGGTLRGVDGVAAVIDQLAGVAVPASAWESLILPSRVRNYSPAMLDELTATGEVIWSGAGSLPGNDGWVALHLAETAPLTLPIPDAFQANALHQAVLDALGGGPGGSAAGGGAYFFRALSDTVSVARGTGATPDADLVTALWDLVWAGRLTNDTLAPLRTLTGGGKSAHSTARPAARARVHGGRIYARPSMPTRVGPPTVGGRWSLLPAAETDATVRGHFIGDQLLERYGVVTRGSVMTERLAGGFALAYKILSGFEETGRSRRGYFVETLGASQFSTGGTIDRLRAFAPDAAPGSPASPGSSTGGPPAALTLAATDPANPYGAALNWPATTIAGHRPGRKAGALVVLVDGRLALYLERGGKTLLTFAPVDEGAGAGSAVAASSGEANPATATAVADLTAASVSLAASVTSGRVAKLTIEKADGVFSIGTPIGRALESAGFVSSPQGMRLRAP
jgi:ATP-dependent Lhr-like helicase